MKDKQQTIPIIIAKVLKNIPNILITVFTRKVLKYFSIVPLSKSNLVG